MRKTSGLMAFAVLCALSAFLLSCGSSSSRPAGLLYVVSQAESNVSSFAINLDSGSLSLINSNATTCLASTSSPAPPPCSLTVGMFLDPTGATAFVLNQGLPPSAPPTIYSYPVNSDGSFGSPIFTALTDTASPQTAIAMARDTTGAFLFVITKSVNPTPSDEPLLWVFGIKPGSTTVTAIGTPIPLTFVPSALSAITYTPSGGSQQTLVLITGILDLTPKDNDNTINVFQVDSSGNVTVPPNSIYTTQVNPTAVFSVNTNQASQNIGGVYVYVGNQAAQSGGLSLFAVCTQVNNTTCTQQDVTNSTLLATGTTTTIGQNPTAMLVDPTNSFLYVLCSGSNAVYAFGITPSTGVLKALTTGSVPTGTTPMGMAMHFNFNQSGQFLYVSNNVSSNITGYDVAVTTGLITNPQTTLFLPGAPSAIAGR